MKLISRKRLLQGGFLLAADGLLFFSTDASKIASPLLIVGFLLLLATIFYLLYGLLGLGRFYGLRLTNRRRLAIYLTVAIGVMVALQSTGELSSRDILVLVPLAILGYLYTAYSRAGRRDSA